MQRATLAAAEVPQEVLEGTVRALELALAAAERGLPASISDAGVAGACARAAAEGAALNVRINAAALQDASEREALLTRQASTLAQAHRLADAVRAAVESKLTP